jgi:hypothetical protein
MLTNVTQIGVWSGAIKNAAVSQEPAICVGSPSCSPRSLGPFFPSMAIRRRLTASSPRLRVATHGFEVSRGLAFDVRDGSGSLALDGLKDLLFLLSHLPDASEEELTSTGPRYEA